MKKRLNPGLAALLEVILLFVPVVPALKLLWPNLEGSAYWIAQVVAYLYLLAGALFIGLRRWNFSQLGFNNRGLRLSIISGAAILLGRTMMLGPLTLGQDYSHITALRVAGEVLFYLGLVGLVEEFLYRGLIYRAFEDWLGPSWAIWGSSLMFVALHLVGRGMVVGAASLVFGLIFGLVRWRSGGIIPLIITHGLIDIQASLMNPVNPVEIQQITILHVKVVSLGMMLLIVLPLYLWQLHPRLVELYHEMTEKGRFSEEMGD